MVSNLRVSGEMVPKTGLRPNSLAVLMVFGVDCFGSRGFSRGRVCPPSPSSFSPWKNGKAFCRFKDSASSAKFKHRVQTSLIKKS